MAKDSKKPAAKGALTKTAIYDDLAQGAGITRKQVALVFEALSSAIKKHLKKDGDTFKVPGMFRVKLQKKPAQKGGKMVPNPFKPGEMMTTKPKPARNALRVTPLKALKDMIQ